MARLLSVALLCLLAPLAAAADKPDAKGKARIAVLEKQIVEQRNKLAALQAELAKLKPQVKAMNPTGMRAGDKAALNRGFEVPKIVKVIDEGSALVYFDFNSLNRKTMLVKFPTKGLADGDYIDTDSELAGVWVCTDPQKVGSTTYQVLEKAKE